MKAHPLSGRSYISASSSAYLQKASKAAVTHRLPSEVGVGSCCRLLYVHNSRMSEKELASGGGAAGHEPRVSKKASSRLLYRRCSGLFVSVPPSRIAAFPALWRTAHKGSANDNRRHIGVLTAVLLTLRQALVKQQQSAR